VHIWRRDPPRARRRNKEYLLNSLPTIESSIPAFHGITGKPGQAAGLVWMGLQEDNAELSSSFLR